MVCIDEEIPFEIPWGWELARFGSVMYNRDSERIPLSVAKRSKLTKIYDYYGASGVIDKVDKYLFNKDLLLIGEDGNNLINRSKPIAYIATGKYWVNNHAHVLDCIDSIFMQYIGLYINSISLVDYVTGTAQPKMNQEKMNSILLPLPPHNEQKRILQKIVKIQPLFVRYEKNQLRLEALTKTLYINLRKSILQEAIQGHLVPQNPNDEPASVLLQRIKEEKQRLVKEGKLKKKDVVDSVIYKGDDNKYYEQIGNKITCIEEEIPFKIPKEWCWVRLSDIVLINPKNHVPDNTMAAFIPMERIDPTFLSSYSYVERKWGEIKQGFTHFSDGDVAFAKITPCFQNRKSMILNNLPNGIGAGTTELKVLRPYRNTLSVEYLLFFLESPYFVEEAIFKGTANQQRIMSGYMESKLFPLPPLEEQKRISKKIREVYKQMIL